MTCNNLTHHALISIGDNTYCAKCFEAGYYKAMDNAGVVYNEDVE